MRNPLQKTTIDLPVVPSKKGFHGMWLVAMICMAIFLTGFVTCYLIAPSVKAEKEILVNPEKVARIERIVLPDIDPEIKNRAKAEAAKMLFNCIGVLEIKDNEAQTVLHKRAAIATKNGFIDLKNTTYPLYLYFIDNGRGYGFAEDPQGNLFRITWLAGATKPPATNPGSFRVVAGKRIEAP